MGEGAGRARAAQNLGKIFFGQSLCKIRTFFGQESCKIQEFCYFWGANIIKIRVF